MVDKKDAIREYKRTVQPMGILRIRNLENGKSFLVASLNLPASVNRHEFQLKLGGHANKALQADYARLGGGRFAFEVLDTLKPAEDPARDSSEDLRALEELWLEQLRPYEPDGYHPAPARRP